MSSFNQIIAGGAAIIVTTQDSEFQKGMNRIEARLRVFGVTMSQLGYQIESIGRAMLAPFTKGVETFENVGAAIELMHQRTGVSEESLSGLRLAANEANVDFYSLGTSFKFMAKAISDVDPESKKTRDSLSAMGLDLTRLRDLKPEDQFYAIADAIKTMANADDRATIAANVFGRAGTNLLPMLEMGRSGLEAFNQEASDTGDQITGKTGPAALDFQRRMQALNAAIEGLYLKLGEALMPTLERFAAWMTANLPKIGDWIEKHQSLTVAAAATAAGLVALGAAMVAIGQAATAASTAMAALRLAASLFGTTSAGLAATGGPVLLLAAAVAYLAYQFKLLEDAIDGAQDAEDHFAASQRTAQWEYSNDKRIGPDGQIWLGNRPVGPPTVPTSQPTSQPTIPTPSLPAGLTHSGQFGGAFVDQVFPGAGGGRGGNPAERIANATEKSADSLGKIERKGALVYR